MGILDGYYGKGGTKAGDSESSTEEFDPTKYSRLKPLSYYAPVASEPVERPNAPGLMSDVRRATGQFVSGAGSTLRDLGVEGVGGAVEQYGADVVRRNPSEIQSFDDVLSRPLTTAREAVGEVAPQVGLALGGQLGGRIVGGALGIPFGPAGIAVGQQVGGFVGGLLPTAVQTYGGIRTEQREKGIDERGRALAVTIPAALLERFGGVERVALRVAGEGTEFLARAAGTGFAKNAGKQFVRGGLEEAITEIPQTGLERYGVTGQMADLSSPEAMNEYGVAGAKAFLGGGSIRAGLSSLAGTRAAEPTVTIQPDGTITSDQPVTGTEGETDLTGSSNVLMTPEQAAQRLQEIQARRPAPLEDTAFEPLPVQRGLFDTRGGEAPPPPVAGEQLDLFGGGGQMDVPVVDERQGDLFAPAEPTFQTRITAGLLDNLGLPRQSSMYRQLLGKDMADPAQQPQIAELFDRVRTDATISERTKAGVEGLAMQAFGGLAQQQEMIGPRGGAYPQGKPSTQQDAPGPIENILPTAPLGATPAEPVTPVGAPVATAAALPAAQPAAGVSSTPVTTGEQSGTQAPQTVETKAQGQKAPVAAGSVVKVNDTEVTLDEQQAAAWNKLQEVHDGKVRRANALKNYQERESALRTAGMQLSAERRKITGALTSKEQQAVGPKNVSEAIKEDNDIDRMLKAVEAEDDKVDKLFASVTGDTKKAPGKPSMPSQVYAAIRNAILNPGRAIVVRKAKSVEKDVAATEKYGTKAKRIAEAATEFAAAYETYASQNLVRSGEIIKRGATAEDAVAGRAAQLKANAAAVQQALAKLGEAVEGNAKDVEAVVRFVKDRAQKEKKGDAKTMQADITLSRAWTAAKSESFMGEPDLLATTGAEVRQSREAAARGATPQLVDAATNGYKIMGKGEAQTGLNGVLNYIRTVGTPFEKTLAQAIKLAVKGKAPIKIEFVKEGTSQYNPKTNAITINENSSKEVALHEALHGALQWFVYTNPNAAQVVALKAALQRVVNYNGALPAKAAEVQALLKKILAGKSKTAELDAVLELVSYGNTLNDFRRALQGIESDAPRTFTKFANDVMDAIYALVRRMLGSSQTVASDVMENTFQLLEAARAATQETAPTKGNILKADITSLDAAAKEAGWADASAFANGPGKFKTPTQLAFEIVGLGRVNGKDLPLTAAIAKNGAKLANYIRKEVPTLERVILNFNSNFSNAPASIEAANNFKFLAQTGHLQMEKISANIVARPDLREPFLDYMDGNANAFDGVKDATAFKAIAENLKGLMKQYISTLPANSKERRAFENMPFTQYIISPNSIGQIAGSTLSASKIASMVGVKTQQHQSLEEFEEFLDTAKGIVDQDQLLYQLFEDKLGKKGLPAGFISKAQYDKTGVTPSGTAVDTKRIWKFSKYDTDKGNFEFSSSITTRDALKVLKGEELALALVNTTAALAHAHAATTYFSNLASIGRESGKPTAEAVAFDSVDEINEVFGERKIELNNVLQASDEASKSQSLRWQTQRTGTWVQLPPGATYGALAGKIVPGPLWNSMIDMHDRTPAINFRSFNELMAFFKQSKTVLNPGTHVTNVLSNVALLLLHGIRLGTLKRAAGMYAKFERNPDSMSDADRKLVQAFFNSGAVLGQFTNSELKGSVYDRLSQAITPASDQSYITRMTSMAKFEQAKATLKGWRDNAAEVYAAEDNVFRFAAFLETAANIQLRDGSKQLDAKQLEEVGLASRQMFLDYDIDARVIRAARQTFFPFVSWSYAIMPVLGRIAVTKPWTMVNMLASVMLMQAALGGEEDDELRKKGQDYLRERSLFGLGPYMHMRIPFVGDDQNPTYLNLGKYIPFLSLFQPPPGESPLAGQSYLPGFVTPGGPLVTLISAMNGYDPFTGKPMHAPTDTEWDKLVATGKATYDTLAPPIFGTKFWNQIGDLKDGAMGPTGIEKSSMFLARTLGGIGLYQFNTDEAAFYKNKEIKDIKKDFKAAMTKAKREEYRKGYPDYAALDKELDELRDRMQKELAKAKGEE